MSKIEVTDKAIKQLWKTMEDSGETKSIVRVGVKGGGCSGLKYDISFDLQVYEGDQTFEDNGVKVVIDKKSVLYLVGTELQYSGGLNGKGFIFHNPNADRTCGCGESFSI